MIQRREIAISIVLTIFTCGIYGIFWFISLSDDIKNASGDQTLPSGGVAFLLSLVTCGIYGIYWAYRMGKALAVAQTRAGFTVTNDNSVLYLILQIFGMGIINYALMQNQLNLIAGNSNGMNGGNTPQQPNNDGQQTSTSQQTAAPAATQAPASQPTADNAQPVATESVEEATVVEEE